MGLRFLKLKAKFSTAPVVILIHDRKAVLLKGIVPTSMLDAFSDLALAYKMNEALITVRKSGGSAMLRFSANIPDTARQRFRNIWFSFPERKTMGV